MRVKYKGSSRSEGVMEFDDAVDVINDVEPHERIKPEEIRRRLEAGETIYSNWITFTKAEEEESRPAGTIK